MPNLETQIEELKNAGYPIKKGYRHFSQEAKKEEAAGIWDHRWAKHAAQNYPIISRSCGISFLKNAAIGMPAFVVGIGPSLDRDITLLKLVKDRGLLLSTDAAYRPLIANGIRPDLVMTLDCQKDQSTMWENMTREQRPPLVCNTCTHPLTIENWNGPILFFNQWHTKDEFIEFLLPYIYPHIGKLQSLGTIGNMLVELAAVMGCSTIIGVGMDLCYEKVKTLSGAEAGWRYRCTDYKFDCGNNEETPTQEGWRKTENKILYNDDERIASSFIEEINGEKFRVDNELKTYRESLVEFVGQVGINFVDCSGGILRMHLRTMALEQAIKEFCNEVFSEGRTVIKYLWKLLPQGTKQWEYDRKNGSAF